jgi:PAS domain S-box-containing protein
MADEQRPETDAFDDLRRRAEERLEAGASRLPRDLDKNLSDLIHELEVYHIELQMQNEELRQAQQALAEARDRYRDLYDLAPMGYLTISEKGMILQANLTAASKLGVRGRTLRQHPFSHYIAPEGQDTYYLRRRALFEHGKPQSWETWLVPEEGARFYAHIEAHLIENGAEEGERACRVAFGDITARFKAEQALAESEKRFRQAITEAPFPIMLHAEDGEVLQVNQRWVALSGYDSEAIPTIEAWAQRTCGAGKAEALSRLRSPFYQQGVVEAGEHPITTRAGETRIWDFSSSLLGKFSGRRLAITMADDVTERRKLEAELARVQKLEAIGQLAGGVAHDFNNKLTAVIGYAALLMNELHPGDPRRGDVRAIEQAAEHMAEVTRQLLALSRQQQIQPQVLDLNQTLQQMRQRLAALVGDAVDLQFALASEPIRTEIDRGQLKQLLTKLVTNAREAVEAKAADIGDAYRGQITLETATCEWEALPPAPRADMMPGQYVMLAVRDNGVGIDQETMGHLFEPFFTTKDWTQRAGLGLAAAYGIAKQNGGHIYVESAPGAGCTFFIYLPQA